MTYHNQRRAVNLRPHSILAQFKFAAAGVVLLALLSSCDITSREVKGVAGKAGQQTAVGRDISGNIFGYYEYLPQDFRRGNRYPLVIFWNGYNTMRGDGRSQLHKLLGQGLPYTITHGKQYPFILLSPQIHSNLLHDIDPFVRYLLRRYRDEIDPRRVYMTGFSAGGGVTVRYALQHAHRLAAIVPIAPFFPRPPQYKPGAAMKRLPSWFFHNYQDTAVNPDISRKWTKALGGISNQHRLTIFESPGHQSWQQTYADDSMWQWLLAQQIPLKPSSPTRTGQGRKDRTQ